MMNNTNKIYSLIRRHYRRNWSRDIQLRLHKIIAELTMSGTDIWILKRNDNKRLEVQYMKLLCSLTGYTLWNHTCNQLITGHAGVTKTVQDIEMN
jgi:hypothetical protein